MEQRRLRLGDILDDYCPRERRVTNHAVVAMIEENVKQTRCTTCEAEHVYKGGKEPRRRKKDAGTVLYEEVLAGMPETPEPRMPVPPVIVVLPEPVAAAAKAADVDDAVDPGEAPPADDPAGPADDGPFHRRLIRATLPRPEGHKEVRQVPDFTIRHNGRSAGHNPFRDRSKMRGPDQGSGGNGQGNRPGGGGGRRFAGGGNPAAPGPRGGRGGRPGFGGGQQRPGGGGRKRSR